MSAGYAPNWQLAQPGGCLPRQPAAIPSCDQFTRIRACQPLLSDVRTCAATNARWSAAPLLGAFGNDGRATEKALTLSRLFPICQKLTFWIYFFL